MPKRRYEAISNIYGLTVNLGIEISKSKVTVTSVRCSRNTTPITWRKSHLNSSAILMVFVTTTDYNVMARYPF